MARPIADVLRELNAGSTYDQLNDGLAQVVAAVRSTRKAGALTFTMKLKPNGELGVEIEDEIKLKIPEPVRPKTLMFIDGADNSLRRTDPRQKEMELRDINKPDEEAEEEALKTA